MTPAPHRLHAAASWQRIDFISDLHLSPELPRTVQAWRQYLQGTAAQAVFILGDLFEVWVGDDARSRPFEASCVQTLQQASQRLALYFVVGNRDFLVGDDMAQACNMQLLSEPVVLDAFGEPTLLCHGDALCLADTDYQQFRRMVRSNEWQHAFLNRPLADRLRIAAEIRSASRGRRQFDGAANADADEAEAVRWLQAAAASRMIHGHTHRPATHSMPGACERWVLSDWDLDDPKAPRAEVLCWSAAGLERRRIAPT